MNAVVTPHLAALAPQPLSDEVRLEKYAKANETTRRDVLERVANALAAKEKSPADAAAIFLAAMEAGFIPAGRILSAAGTDLSATLMNCFVQPLGDSTTGYDGEGRPGIYTALSEAAETMRRGGGVGYDFSELRPEGAAVKGTASRASGPVSYMRVFDRSCETVESAGARRGAQMGVLRCDHPDIAKFIHAKDQGDLSNFNISIAATDAFMEAVVEDGSWELVHKATPSQALIDAGAHPRDDGKWVYGVVKARDLWKQIMESTYDHAEPGVLFIDRANKDNNLWYCETFAATNPCAEQFLPPYGCCDLGAINLTQFVNEPFTPRASFDFVRFAAVIPTAVRMLDNVLDLTVWPLEQQRREAENKRRVGLGFMGLGDALLMLGLRYNSAEARQMAAKITETMRDAAYEASVDLAMERGAFPALDVAQYLASPSFASRLPDDIKNRIRKHGIRNSHLLSIAPTGTIAIAMADNATNGIEPAFSWTYTRKKRQSDGSIKEYVAEDFAYRLFRHLHGETAPLPDSFVSAQEIEAVDHELMVEAVAPFVDSAISKTVNVPADYPFERFEDLYLRAWRGGLKGIATYRPNSVIGSVLSVTPTNEAATPSDLIQSDPDRRIVLSKAPTPALASLRWPGRPKLPDGNMAWTYMLEHTHGSFAVFVGEVQNGRPHPFEVWVNGSEQPRGMGAVAKTLSMDMRTEDPAWVAYKLDALKAATGEASDAFDMPMPPDGETRRVPSVISAFAQIVQYRMESVGALTAEGDSPMLGALISKKEPKTGPNGTMSWTVDVSNHACGDDFVLGLKELQMPDGQHVPFSIWLSGVYPRALDGLCKLLSIDMRIVDPAWIGTKLRKLLDYQEPMGDFMAREPGSEKQRTYPSTIAYVARLVIHRYAMLGILDEQGYPLQSMGVLDAPEVRSGATQYAQAQGKLCGDCNTYSVIRKDGCDWCTACGATGSCG